MGLSYSETEYAVRKYKSHRRIPASLRSALRALTFRASALRHYGITALWASELWALALRVMASIGITGISVTYWKGHCRHWITGIGILCIGKGREYGE